MRAAKDSVTSVLLSTREVVGLAGVVGAGRTELAETLYGLRPLIAGEVFLNGDNLRGVSSENASPGAGLFT